MDLGLRDKTCLVTASTGGLGLAIVESLAGEGAHVVVNGRENRSVSAAMDRVRATVPGAALSAAVGNTATRAGCDAVIATCPAADVVVINLGIYEAADIFEATDEQWQRLIETNVMSGVRLSRHYLKAMLARNAGRIIFMASESGINPAPEMPHYSATKTMQISLARNLAETTKGTRVTVNSVLPGPSRTEGVAQLIAGLYPGMKTAEAEHQFILDNRPTSLIQRLTEPREVGDIVAFLASDRTAIINGAALRIDGGLIRTVM
jgi:3-oxoacyl-[acyl-carrier protein] reductase